MIWQTAVFVENKQGSGAALCSALAKEGVDMLAFNIADGKDFGIARCITRDHEKAVAALKKHGYAFGAGQIVGASVSDKPGTMAEILGILSDAGFIVEYCYAFAHIAKNAALIFLQTNDNVRAEEVLLKAGVNVLSGDII